MMLDIFLLLILLICVITDLRSRKIYNKVIYPALLVTLVYHLAAGGLEGLSHSFIGFLTGLGLLLIPYLMGGMGAGDVKLLALIGAVKGSMFVFQSFLYIAILGAGIAVVVLFARRGMFKSVVYYLASLRNGIVLPGGVSRGSMTATYPYGVAIAGGVVLCMVIQGGRFLW
ncbi:prepilin peptidase [Virgibacillus kekensis]|uniref:Prepilin peptidase n=1 Tax=Virgibacillus kekensis TaxID=202261 RepID=A0ABV9DFM6_9BACI